MKRRFRCLAASFPVLRYLCPPLKNGLRASFVFLRSKNLSGFFLFSYLVLGLIAGCSDSQSSLESELCTIYRHVNAQDVKDHSSKEGFLAESIQRELPDFFNAHYVNLMRVEWARRAEILDRLLSELDQSRSPGLCQPVAFYYEQPIIITYGD